MDAGKKKKKKMVLNYNFILLKKNLQLNRKIGQRGRRNNETSRLKFPS